MRNRLGSEALGAPSAPIDAVRWSRLFVTRPAAEAQAWVQSLRSQGWPALALPLIDIVEPQDKPTRAALTHARAHWADWDALMFVSAAAVNHFFSPSMPVSTRPLPGTRFWAPGPGTARALARALAPLGLDASHIDAPPDDAAQFDSEHLWPVVADQVRAGHRLLVVRGASEGSPATVPTDLAGRGRDWMIQRCEAHGSSVQACVAYERHAPTWTDRQRAEAEAGAAPGSLWLFSGSEAVHNLTVTLPGRDWSHATALCTHDRIAATARAAGFGRILVGRPALADVLRTLESVQSHS